MRWSRGLNQAMARALAAVLMISPEAAVKGHPPPALPGLPPIPFPRNNPYSLDKFELGGRLFSDPRLSANDAVSCRSCHQPEHGFADPRGLSTGVTAVRLRVKTPTLLNAAYSSYYFHDGHASSLEEQIAGPLLGRDEMGMTRQMLEDKVSTMPEYRRAFREIFGRPAVRFSDLLAALATYVRCQVSAGSRFDLAYFSGERGALSQSEKRGFDVFVGAAGCARCHAIAGGFALFTDNSFHNLGVGFDLALPPTGLLATTGNERHRGKIKTPTLRNAAIASRFMHDGRFTRLSEVIDFYDRGGLTNPNLSPLLFPLGLTAGEKRDLEAFLHTLVDLRYVR
jgi:cytochrome c peroxidase